MGQVYDIRHAQNRMEAFEREERISYVTMKENIQTVFPMEVRSKTKEHLSRNKIKDTPWLTNGFGLPDLNKSKSTKKTKTESNPKEILLSQKEPHKEEERLNKFQNALSYFSPKEPESDEPDVLEFPNDPNPESANFKESCSEMVVPKENQQTFPSNKEEYSPDTKLITELENSKSTDYYLAPNGAILPGTAEVFSPKPKLKEDLVPLRSSLNGNNFNSPVIKKKDLVFPENKKDALNL